MLTELGGALTTLTPRYWLVDDRGDPEKSDRHELRQS
jgi:hypothetical protein